jgi:phosphate transport system substrate-binding protein
MVRFTHPTILLLGCTWLAVFLGCGRGANEDKGKDENLIRVEGSDTMVKMAEVWAEVFRKTHPSVNIQVLGGGSTVGIASLVDGNCDMADASRKMEDLEIKRVKANRGDLPKEIVVGYDTLTIYVHQDNPLDSISIEELADIYGEDGKITKWSQLGVKDGKLADSDIARVNRQKNSGTYTYFHDVVLGKGKAYKNGLINQSGARDVVAFISRTPSAIGYSGMGCHAPEVKMLKVSRKKGDPAVEPTIQNARHDTYPLTRPLQIVVVGKPAGAIKEYLDWILGPEGQKVVLDQGYVPVKQHESPL